MKEKIVFIGAGNLGTALAKELYKKGFQIQQVYSRTQKSAKELADKVESNYITSAKDIIADAGIYFVTLKDSAWSEVLPFVNFGNNLVIHCSGSMPIFELHKYTSNCGVLYPLQTFSKEREVDFSSIPVFIESESEKNVRILREIAVSISKSVTVLNSEKRLYLHIAAVFACNFVNHFYEQASDVLKIKGIPFGVLKPLIYETAQKVQELNPFDAQTGPAVRYDENIIRKHLEALESNPSTRELYKLISKSIFEHHQKKS